MSSAPACPDGVLCINPWAFVCGFVIVGLCMYIYVLHNHNTDSTPHTDAHTQKHTEYPRDSQNTSLTHSNNHPDHQKMTITHLPLSANNHISDYTNVHTNDHSTIIPSTTASDVVISETVLSPPRIQYTTNVNTNTYESGMLQPPLRRSPGTSRLGLMPINIETRGETPEMQQVGILRSKTNDKVLALYGRPTYRGSSKWIYYTGTDKYHSIKLPVEKNNKNCTAEYGCDELFDDDEVQVKGYDGPFQTNIYQLDAPRYIPFVA